MWNWFDPPREPFILDDATAAARFADQIDGMWKKLSLSETLKLLRKRRLMTQQELALRSGYSQSAISDIETGRSDPAWGTIRAVLWGLDCVPLLLPRPTTLWPRRPNYWRDERSEVPRARLIS